MFSEIEWKKEIDFDFGNGLSAKGFAAILEQGSYSSTGFALFRRGRLIEGSADEGYKPTFIFGQPNSALSLRLFGELELEGFDVSHTKDGFRWEENEETFLDLLKESLNNGPIPLLKQAQEHRSRPPRDELKRGAEAAIQSTAEIIQREVPQVIEQINYALPSPELPESLPGALMVSTRTIPVVLNEVNWEIILEMTNDPAQGDWVEIFDQPANHPVTAEGTIRRVGVRMALNHPFMERFANADSSTIEPLLRIAAALGLAEVVARQGGGKYVGQVRDNINKLLRDALSKS